MRKPTFRGKSGILLQSPYRKNACQEREETTKHYTPMNIIEELHKLYPNGTRVSNKELKATLQ
jgi:hypothetical protein